MKQAKPRPYEHIVHPYVFVLKEGQGIKKDYLDYSLQMFQVGLTEVIRSPKNKHFPLIKNKK